MQAVTGLFHTFTLGSCRRTLALAREYAVVGTSLYVVQDKVTTSVVAMRSSRGSAVDLIASPTTGSALISQNIDGRVGDSTSSVDSSSSSSNSSSSSSNTGNIDSSSSSSSSNNSGSRSSSIRASSSYPRLGSDVVASGSGSSSEKKGSVRGAKVASIFSEEVFLFHRMSSYR